MSTSVAERVTAGAEWLDEHEPGWVERISVDRLDIANPFDCVLGQLYGNYWGAPLNLFNDEDEGSMRAAVLGFSGEEFDLLTVEWRALIKERVAA